MIRKLLLVIGLLLCATGLHAQTQNTTVTGTIVGSDGSVWQNAAVTAVAIPPNTLPISTTTSTSGIFTLILPSTISGGTLYQFQVSTQGILPTKGTGPQSFQGNILISGGSQNVGSTLSALAPALLNPNTSGGVTALTTRLRSLEILARARNAFINPPLQATQSWAPATTYALGTIVTNAGGSYLCATAGTSASSGTGPVSTAAQIITDNTASWYFLNSTSAIQSDYTAPVITVATARPSGLNTDFDYASNTSLFFITGGVPAAEAGSTYCIASNTVISGGNCTATQQATQFAISVMTDAPKFAIRTNNNNTVAWRLLVDDQYITLSGTQGSNAGNPNYFTVDFTSSGGRKARKITLEASQAEFFRGITVGSAIDSVWTPDSADNVRAAFVGDSLVAGGNGFPVISGKDWAHQVGKLLGWNDIWVLGLGSTGYQASTAANPNYITRIADVTSIKPDIVLVEGSTNDTGFSPTSETAAVVLYLTTLRAALPSVPIIVFGLFNTSSNASTIASENAISAGITQVGDPNIYFIPVSTDPAGAWFTGTGNITATTGNGNADVYIGSDAIHPDEIGINYLAQKVAKSIRQLIQKSFK